MFASSSQTLAVLLIGVLAMPRAVAFVAGRPHCAFPTLLLHMSSSSSSSLHPKLVAYEPNNGSTTAAAFEQYRPIQFAFSTMDSEAAAFAKKPAAQEYAAKTKPKVITSAPSLENQVVSTTITTPMATEPAAIPKNEGATLAESIPTPEESVGVETASSATESRPVAARNQESTASPPTAAAVSSIPSVVVETTKPVDKKVETMPSKSSSSSERCYESPAQNVLKQNRQRQQAKQQQQQQSPTLAERDYLQQQSPSRRVLEQNRQRRMAKMQQQQQQQHE